MAEFFSKGVFTPFVHLSVTPVSLSIFFNVPVGISLDGWFDIGTLYPVGLTASMACSLPLPSVHPASLRIFITSPGFIPPPQKIFCLLYTHKNVYSQGVGKKDLRTRAGGASAAEVSLVFWTLIRGEASSSWI